MMLQEKRKIHTSIYHYYYSDLLLSEDSVKSISRKLSQSWFTQKPTIVSYSLLTLLVRYCIKIKHFQQAEVDLNLA